MHVDMNMETASTPPLDGKDAISIPEWYRGRSVFITGGSGFMGKVLVEKLLRSCPELRTVYLLLRVRKGRCARERLEDITKTPLFERLRSEQPAALAKLVAVEGDVMQGGLGLSPSERGLLEREVSVVFHSAASVRFDDPLSAAILMNVRGTREVLQVATGFRDLQAFVHFSTAYSNCEQVEVGEHLYPPPGGLDWRLAIRIAENEALAPVMPCLTPKVLGRKLNTYVFAKALAEHVVNDYRRELPVVIVRPSVVLSTYEEPVAGWIENFNGPIAVWMGGYTGVLRICYVNAEGALDLVPVDSAIKSIIYIAYHFASYGPRDAERATPVYNCSALYEPCSFQRQPEIGLPICRESPTTQMIWPPNQQITESWPIFYVQFMLTHVAPGLLLDAVLEYRGEKPRLMRLYRTMYTAIKNMYVFTKTFTFHNEQFLALERCMLPSDRRAFAYATQKPTNSETTRLILLGARRYLLQDPIETLPRARRMLRRFDWLQLAFQGVLVMALAWTLVGVATSTLLVTPTAAVATL